MKRYKTTTFREGYNPTFPEFLKSHKNVIALEDMAEAYEVVTGRKPERKDLKQIDVINETILEDNGNTSTATRKGREAKPKRSN